MVNSNDFYKVYFLCGKRIEEEIDCLGKHVQAGVKKLCFKAAR